MIWTLTVVTTGLVMQLGNVARLGLLVRELSHDTAAAKVASHRWPQRP
jgi:hypothetical protein